MPYINDRLIGEIRLECGTPETNQPSDDLILMKIGDVAQLLHNQAQNTSHAWSVNYYDLPAQAGKADYLIPLDRQWGKPQRVHTINPTDRYHVNRSIPIFERQNIEEAYRGPQEAMGGTHWTPHTAAAFIFYYKFGNPYADIVPTPAEPARYRLWFETGEIPEPKPDGNTPVIAPFARYLRVKAALLVMSHCEWAGNTKDENRERRAELADPLIPFVNEWEKTWRSYIQTSHQWGTSEPAGYADDYFNDSW